MGGADDDFDADSDTDKG